MNSRVCDVLEYQCTCDPVRSTSANTLPDPAAHVASTCFDIWNLYEPRRERRQNGLLP